MVNIEAKLLRGCVRGRAAFRSQFVVQATGAPRRTLRAPMSIQNAKVTPIATRVHDMCILHVGAPAIHLGQPDAKLLGTVPLEHSATDWFGERCAHLPATSESWVSFARRGGHTDSGTLLQGGHDANRARTVTRTALFALQYCTSPEAFRKNCPAVRPLCPPLRAPHHTQLVHGTLFPERRVWWDNNATPLPSRSRPCTSSRAPLTARIMVRQPLVCSSKFAHSRRSVWRRRLAATWTCLFAEPTSCSLH